jgi:hypothetical protein
MACQSVKERAIHVFRGCLTAMVIWRVGGTGWGMGGEGVRFKLCSSSCAARQIRSARCLQEDLLGARASVGEDGGGGDLIEVEGGVVGEGEARSHPMEKVQI